MTLPWTTSAVPIQALILRSSTAAFELISFAIKLLRGAPLRVEARPPIVPPGQRPLLARVFAALIPGHVAVSGDARERHGLPAFPAERWPRRGLVVRVCLPAALHQPPA